MFHDRLPFTANANDSGPGTPAPMQRDCEKSGQGESAGKTGPTDLAFPPPAIAHSQLAPGGDYQRIP